MEQVILRRSHEDLFLEQGYYFALSFREGWFIGRVVDRAWSNLQPWSLGPVVAGGNLAAFDTIQDATSRHYLEPPKEELVYHSFWGVTPIPARIKIQFPSREDLGSMLEVTRTLTDNVGFVDGYKSPFWGPYSHATELFTVKESYPAVQVNDPLPDNMANVMLNIDQRQYTYQIITDKALIKTLLVGNQRVKKFTMGPLPLPMSIPQWLQKDITDEILAYTKNVMAGKV